MEKNQIVRCYEANVESRVHTKHCSGETSCDGVHMKSGLVAFFLGFKYLWYLLFREQTQASENPREHTQRHRYSI